VATPVGLVIFDLDGTLAETREDLTAAVGAMLQRRGLPGIGVDDLRRLVGEGARRLVEKALAPHGAHDVDAALVDFLVAYDACLLDRTRLRAGAVEALAACRPAKVAVCTNKPRRSTGRILEGLGLLPHLDAWLAGDDLAAKKPDPLPILNLADRFGVGVARTVVVGDGLPDVGAARAAGATSVALLDGYTDAADLRRASPDLAFEDLAAATRWLASQTRA
jgi:phosphoglycolate phosphatase